MNRASGSITGSPEWPGHPATVPRSGAALVARMGHDSERAAMIYLHEMRGADRAIDEGHRCPRER